MRLSWFGSAALMTAVLTPPYTPDGKVSRLASQLAAHSSAVPRTSQDWEHRYRVGGKVRLLVVWVGNDDVGGARVSRRQLGSSVVTSFLGGSDPDRAPRKLNQWGYVLEEVSGDAARVFTVRTLGRSDALEAEWRLAREQEGAEAIFGAACSSSADAVTHATVTGVRTEPAITYRRFDRVLAAVASSPQWESQPRVEGSDAYPGFFTALQSALDASVAVGAGVAVPTRAYLHKGAMFDLTVRKVESPARGLLHGRYFYRSRSTGEGGTFNVTFGADGEMAGIPIEIEFQPNWWLKVALRLDDSADVPDDPSHDAALATHIKDICSRALAQGPVAQ